MSDEPVEPDEPVGVPSRWAPFLPSLIAALGVLAWLVIVVMLSEILRFAARGFDTTLLRLGDTLRFELLPDSVAVLGVLFSFWLVSPITDRDRIRTVTLKSLIAAGVAAIFVWPVLFLVRSAYYAELGQQQVVQGGLYDVEPIVAPQQTLVEATTAAVGMGVGLLPLIVLAALGSWAWQRRSTAHGET